ncbi:MAG TPA: BON domain-containing protein [Gemmataceae bacterium]|jgi:osmotically-inducible protein OsmY|nr:BON domain-containing protein [Gemmataceae bacterium]
MHRLLILVAIALAGCSREDGERLARVGKLAGEKVRDAAPARTPLDKMNPESTPAGRVRARLRTDAALADQPIQVVEGADGLHLRGQVATEDQIEWAGKLASETLGVGAVVNELAVGP